MPTQNATPDQLSIDDQLIALVRVARALGYDDAAEWISKRAMAQVDKEIAEVSEPRKCVQTVNVFGRIMKVPCGVNMLPVEINSYHDTGGAVGYCDQAEDGKNSCEHHDPIYAPTPASEPSRTDAEAAAFLYGSHRGCDDKCPRRKAVDTLLAAVADAEKRAKDAVQEAGVARSANANLTLQLQRETDRSNGFQFARDLLREENATLTRKLATALTALRAADAQFKNIHDRPDAGLVARAIAAKGYTDTFVVLASIDAPAHRHSNTCTLDRFGKCTAAEFEVPIDAPAGEGAPDESDALTLAEFWRRQAAWSNATFGNEKTRGPVGPLRHLQKEIQEAIGEALLEHSDHLVEEIGDCFALAVDAARRAGMTPQSLIAQVTSKLEINKSREWPKVGSDKPVEHVRSTPSTILPATHIAEPDSSFPVSGTGGTAQGSEAQRHPPYRCGAWCDYFDDDKIAQRAKGKQ